jgi:hypothetical protein
MAKTYQKQFESAMKCKTKSDAEKWLKKEVAYNVKNFGQSPENAERVIKANLGYMAGYYTAKEARKVKNLFGALHPIFGDTTVKSPTPEEAFAAGEALAKVDGESLADNIE